MPPFLRPPGAAPEKDFRARCVSCGQCAQVCNYHCVELTPDYPFGPDTPKILQRKSPCWLCMKCSDICPTGALSQVRMEEAGMGLARLNLQKCVDYQEDSGLMCWTCYDRCPLRGKAIVLDMGYIPKVTGACAGCGVCEYVCPIAAITVTPVRLLAEAARDGGCGAGASREAPEFTSGNERPARASVAQDVRPSGIAEASGCGAGASREAPEFTSGNERPARASVAQDVRPSGIAEAR